MRLPALPVGCVVKSSTFSCTTMAWPVTSVLASTAPVTSLALAGGGAFLSPLANATVPTSSDIPPRQRASLMFFSMGVSSAFDADHVGQTGNIAQNLRDALEKIDRGRPLLD